MTRFHWLLILVSYKNEDWLFRSKQFFLQNIWLNNICLQKLCFKNEATQWVFFRLYLKREFLSSIVLREHSEEKCGLRPNNIKIFTETKMIAFRRDDIKIWNCLKQVIFAKFWFKLQKFRLTRKEVQKQSIHKSIERNRRIFFLT